MSDLATIYESISDVSPTETMTLEQIIASVPALTLYTPLTYHLYLYYNKNLSDKEIAITNAIINKLVKNEQAIAKKNLEYLTRDITTPAITETATETATEPATETATEPATNPSSDPI